MQATPQEARANLFDKMGWGVGEGMTWLEEFRAQVEASASAIEMPVKEASALLAVVEQIAEWLRPESVHVVEMEDPERTIRVGRAIRRFGVLLDGKNYERICAALVPLLQSNAARRVGGHKGERMTRLSEER